MQNAGEFKETIFITGGAGFIGANLVEYFTENYPDYLIAAIDALTYAGNRDSLEIASKRPNFRFEKIDIIDTAKLEELFAQYRPNGVIHLAAETHVDRSIDNPAIFIDTNIRGTFNLLEEIRKASLNGRKIRFHHVSTDEVFGAEQSGGLFTEQNKYNPNSPYAASKAAADHLVRAWSRTYRIDTVTTNCGNNFGPYQYPEKLIPMVMVKALSGQPIPIYGDGQQIRDWIYVRDHCRGIDRVYHDGQSGETYNIGARSEKTNLDLVKTICRLLDQKTGQSNHEKLISFTEDRPGHDRRYAIDPSKIEKELDWSAEYSFDKALENTIDWYLGNRTWLDNCLKREQQSSIVQLSESGETK